MVLYSSCFSSKATVIITNPPQNYSISSQRVGGRSAFSIDLLIILESSIINYYEE